MDQAEHSEHAERRNPERLEQARALTRLLDSAVRVPGTSFRIGLDPVLGLVPGLGDAVGAAMAGYLVLLAARLGAPTAVIARMVGNVALDAAVGAIPFFGDIYDFFWKSNRRNLNLLERYVEQPVHTARRATAVVVGAVAGIAAIAVAGVALAFWAVASLVSLLS